MLRWFTVSYWIWLPSPYNVDMSHFINFLIGPLNIVWWRWDGFRLEKGSSSKTHYKISANGRKTKTKIGQATYLNFSMTAIYYSTYHDALNASYNLKCDPHFFLIIPGLLQESLDQLIGLLVLISNVFFMQNLIYGISHDRGCHLFPFLHKNWNLKYKTWLGGSYILLHGSIPWKYKSQSQNLLH